jgi:putative sigma-54 modulation protein
MKYQIVGKNIIVTDAIRQTLEKKLSKMDKYFVINDNVDCRVVVSSYKDFKKVEVTIFTKQMTFRVEVKNPDLYAAMDVAIDRLEGQMRKLKTQMSRRNKVSLGEAIAFENFEADEEEFNKEDDQIVRTKSIFLEPMSLDEAVIRMEALDHAFFLYLDKDDNLISLLYHRNDGGLGIIQAENHLK